MNELNYYLVGGYAIGLALLWGYAFLLLLETRVVSKAERAREHPEIETVD